MAASVAYTHRPGQPPGDRYPAPGENGDGCGRTVVCVAGAVQEEDVPRLVAVCEAALAASPAGIDLDLAGVTCCSPAARTALTRYWEQVRASGRTV
ncbi:hypothetical protein ACFVXK_37685, partial [Streptomyces sp. NPDC058157]